MMRTEGYFGSLVEDCLKSCHLALDFGADQVRLGIIEGAAHAVVVAEKEVDIVLRLLPEIVDAAQRGRCAVDLEMILIRFCTLQLQTPAKYCEA
jgi:hypothetical protein